LLNRWFIISMIVLALAGGAGVYWWFNRTAAAASPTTAPTTVTQVAKGSILVAVASTGRVVSNLDVDIKCKASGEIVNLPFDVSQYVKKDDLLMELDPVDELRAVRLAEVALAQSQAKLAQSKQSLQIAQRNLETSTIKADAALVSSKSRAKDLRSKADRRKELLLQQLSSQEEFSTADADAVAAESDVRTAQMQVQDLKSQEITIDLRKEDVKLAEAQVQSDTINLENARQRLADTKVVAPMDAVVSALNVQKGQIISSGITNVGGGTTAMTLSDMSRMFVLAAVDESDIGKVKLEQLVNISVDAYPGKLFEGKVVRIATRGVNVSNVVTFECKIEIVDKKRSLLKPEMTANVQVVVARRDDVLVVPAQAITRKQGKASATIVTGETSTEQPIELGLTDGEKWEVTSGLTEGQTVTVRKEVASKWRGGSGGSGGPPPGMMMGGPRR
jgi:HlyD family secretion protein